MYSKKSLVTTTDNISKEGINDMGTKPNVLKESITPPISKNNICTVNKIEKPQAYKSIKDKSISNKPNKGISLDKSVSTQITEIEDTVKSVNKSRSISSVFLSDKSTKI